MPSSHSVRVSNATLSDVTYMLLKRKCMLSEVLRIANDSLGALEATTSQTWSVVVGAQGSHRLSRASSPVQLLDPGPSWNA